MIDKKSNEGLICIHCGEPAVKDSNPPVCTEHLKLEKHASNPDSLDVVSQDPDIWNKE